MKHTGITGLLKAMFPCCYECDYSSGKWTIAETKVVHSFCIGVNELSIFPLVISSKVYWQQCQQ